MEIERKIKWCIKQHEETNHFYDKYLPYEFHLRMVAKVANDFIKVIERSADGDVDDWVDTIIVVVNSCNNLEKK